MASDFDVGDRVRVAKDVTHACLDGASSRGLVGVVTSVWHICEEDPVCCCAELAFDAPIEVSFEDKLDGLWSAHFALDELEMLPPILHWRE